MTREEVKSCIFTIKMLQRLAYNIHGVMDVIDADNCKKIIKALEQEPCEDCISRQTLDEIKELMTDINGDTVYAVRMSDLRQLPSVTPQPKMGQWIRIDKDKLKCSECEVIHYIAQYPQSANINYCPNCGTKMVEPKESEVRNEYV